MNCLLLGVLVTAASWAQAPAQAPTPGLYVSPSGVLMKDGKPFRGIGVDYITLFTKHLADPHDLSYEDGLRVLAEHGIPCVRIFGGPFWPKQWQLYFDDRAAYFKRFDDVVKAAERYKVGLIPSLFWNMPTVPDLVREPCDQWGNPDSKVIAFMRQYTQEVVTRYVKSPAIWGWEFGNEYNLAADLPNAAEHRPPIVPDLGTALTRSAKDDLTNDMVRAAIRQFALAVRKYDPYRMIDSGCAFPRPSAWHQMHDHSWTKDTAKQRAEMLLGDNPDPVDTICVHAYDDYTRLPETMKVAEAAKKPLFVGEFGAQNNTPATHKQFTAMLGLIEQLKVPLACMWVYDYNAQDKVWNVSAKNARSWMLTAVAEANKRIRAESGG